MGYSRKPLKYKKRSNYYYKSKFHRCVEQAKALTTVKHVRYIYVSDMLIGGISTDYIKY